MASKAVAPGQPEAAFAVYEVGDRVIFRQAWGGGEDLPARVTGIEDDRTYAILIGNRQVERHVAAVFLLPAPGSGAPGGGADSGEVSADETTT